MDWTQTETDEYMEFITIFRVLPYKEQSAMLQEWSFKKWHESVKQDTFSGETYWNMVNDVQEMLDNAFFNSPMVKEYIKNSRTINPDYSELKWRML